MPGGRTRWATPPPPSWRCPARACRTCPAPPLRVWRREATLSTAAMKSLMSSSFPQVRPGSLVSMSCSRAWACQAGGSHWGTALCAGNECGSSWALAGGSRLLHGRSQLHQVLHWEPGGLALDARHDTSFPAAPSLSHPSLHTDSQWLGLGWRGLLVLRVVCRPQAEVWHRCRMCVAPGLLFSSSQDNPSHPLQSMLTPEA